MAQLLKALSRQLECCLVQCTLADLSLLLEWLMAQFLTFQKIC